MPDSPFLLAARGLHLWAVAVLFGGAGFMLLLRDTSRLAGGLLRGAAVVAGLSGAAWFAATFVEITDSWNAFLDPGAWEGFLGAPFGPPWAIRLGLCAAALALAGGSDLLMWLVLGAGFVVDQAWLGHTAMASGKAAALQVAVYWLHVAAGFAWVGALVMICSLALERGRVPARGLVLFSTIGIAVVAAVVLSGLVNAGFRGVTSASVLTTDYGRLLAAKLGLVAIMVAFALVNRRRGRNADSNASPTLWLEAVAGLVVLLVAAALGVTAPPNGEP